MESSLYPPDLVEAELARRSLRKFIEHAWPLVEPEKPFVRNWHIDELCAVLEAVTRGEIRRVIVNIPPGSMKSLLLVFWAAWEWASNPALRYFTASYSDHLTIRDNLRLRAIVTSPWYQRNFVLRLSNDQAAKQLFETTAKGWRLATSVGGGGTGEHPDRIVIDDPLTAEEARSEAERKRCPEWFDGTVSTRGVSRDCRIVLIMQRLHEEDLSGYLLAKGGWDHVCWPMRFEKERADRRDRRTEQGELLWPALFPEHKVAALEADLGSYKAAGQLQQRPAPEEGGRIKRTWWGRFVEPPAAPAWDMCLMSMDLSVEDTEQSDPIAWLLMVLTRGQVLLLDGFSARMATPEVLSMLRARSQLWPQATCKLIENKAAGPHVIQLLRNEIPGIVPWPQKGVPHPSKEQRVWACEPFLEAGNVLVPSPESRYYGPWVNELIEQCASFPMAGHDDWVDALTQGLLYLYPSAWGRVQKDWKQANAEANRATTVAELQQQIRKRELREIMEHIEGRRKTRGATGL
jgi:predicted phage terminase large subunit-like protein